MDGESMLVISRSVKYSINIQKNTVTGGESQNIFVFGRFYASGSLAAYVALTKLQFPTCVILQYTSTISLGRHFHPKWLIQHKLRHTSHFHRRSTSSRFSPLCLLFATRPPLPAPASALPLRQSELISCRLQPHGLQGWYQSHLPRRKKAIKHNSQNIKLFL